VRCGYRVLKGEREQRAASGAACGFCRDGALQERPAGGLAVAILFTACTAQLAASSSLRDAYRYCVLPLHGHHLEDGGLPVRDGLGFGGHPLVEAASRARRARFWWPSHGWVSLPYETGIRAGNDCDA
jgi:hypothetical protein